MVSANHKHLIIEKKQEKMTLLGLRKTSWSLLKKYKICVQDQQAGCCSSQPKKYKNQCHCSAHQQFDGVKCTQNQAPYDLVNCPEKHA